MQKTCPECGEKIIGRVDKKFCSDQCRNAHHNDLNKSNQKLIRTVNTQLRKNYKILQTLNPKDKTKVKKAKLLASGFDFEFFTNIYTTKAGTIYYFVYDQGYLPLDHDFYALVKRNTP